MNLMKIKLLGFNILPLNYLVECVYYNIECR